MLPRAELHDPRAVAHVTRPLRGLAWWRSPSPATYAAGHCLTAGALQLLALLAELGRTGRPLPAFATMLWAALGLAMIAALPVAFTIALRTVRAGAPRASRLGQAALVGGVWYGALPLMILADGHAAVALLAPVAFAWHLTLAGAPPRP